MHGIQGLFEEDSAQTLQSSYHDALTGERLSVEESAVAERVFAVHGKDEVFKDSVQILQSSYHDALTGEKLNEG